MHVTLKEFLNLDDEFTKRLRIRLNDKNGESNAIDTWLEDPSSIDERAALWYSGKQWFHVGDKLISLVRVDGDDWLLTSIQEVIEVIPHEDDFVGVIYKTKRLEQFKHFEGTLHVLYHRDCQAQVRYHDSVENEMLVKCVTEEPYNGKKFENISSVSLSFCELERIIQRNISDWMTGLSASKAIYLVRDKATGKMYVGSAASDGEMLLARWKNYIADGHGGNKEFKAIVNSRGLDYVKQNFEYSVLEAHDYRVDTNFILEREQFFKKILHTSVAEGGMNWN